MKSVANINVLRILSRPIGRMAWTRRLAETYAERDKREACIAHSTARLLPESRILNTPKNKGCIEIGANTVLRGECNIFQPAGKIRIGSDSYVGEDSRIWSAVGVTIGDRVSIAHSVNIHDHDSHPISAAERHKQVVGQFSGKGVNLSRVKMAPIVIEDDVRIGFNAVILKGVTISRGAYIEAEAVITKNVLACAIMAGNPAQQVGTTSK